MGMAILKSPTAIDTLVGLGTAQYLIKKLKQGGSKKIPAPGSEGFWRNPDDWA